MRMFKFNAPQERLGPRFFTSTQDYAHVNAGRFVRNAVLAGKVYAGNDLAPGWLTTRDAIHPLAGTQSIDGEVQTCYGGLLDSVNSDATKAAIRCVVQPWNTSTVWAPGGRGLDSWLAAKLPEATLVERYIIASTNTTCPLSWKLQGSNDGSAWADLDVVTNTEMWSLATAREEKVFTIPEISRGTYLWYRIYITGSNATTMSISTFRLLRPASVCDRGQLRLDASAANPLVMSFMDGFASDGVTPVDHVESLSAPAVFDLATMNCNIPAVNTEAWAHCDIVASKYAGGGCAVTLEACNTGNALFGNQGMKGNVDGGFKVTTVTGTEAKRDQYIGWARYNGTTSTGSAYDTKSQFSRIDGKAFYVEKIVPTCTSYANFHAIELDGSITTLGSIRVSFDIKRSLLGLQRDASIYGYYIYSCASPYKYRISGGKLYQQERNISADWTPVQKIKLGTCDIYNGEICNLTLRSAASMQWMTDGNNLSTI